MEKHKRSGGHHLLQLNEQESLVRKLRHAKATVQTTHRNVNYKHIREEMINHLGSL
jgi:hypothetical protein